MKSIVKPFGLCIVAAVGLFVTAAHAVPTGLTPSDLTISRLGINSAGYVFFDFEEASATAALQQCNGLAYFLNLDTPTKRNMYNTALAAKLAGKKIRSVYFDKDASNNCSVIQFEAAP